MSRTAESASTEQHQAHRLLRLTHINATSSSTEVYDVGRLLEIITSTLLHHHSYTPSRRTCWQGLWFFTQLSPSTVFHSHSGRSEPFRPAISSQKLVSQEMAGFLSQHSPGLPTPSQGLQSGLPASEGSASATSPKKVDFGQKTLLHAFLTKTRSSPNFQDPSFSIG